MLMCFFGFDGVSRMFVTVFIGFLVVLVSLAGFLVFLCVSFHGSLGIFIFE